MFTLKIKLFFLNKICHFLKKKNCYVRYQFFFIHRLGSRKVYQKKMKKLGVAI
jgi:hypothetical protein